MQDQAFLGPGGGAGRARREDGGVELYVADPVAARRPRPGRGLPRPAAGEGAPHPRRRRRRLRRPRGREPADPRLPAGAAHRPAGEDGLRPRGVLLRPRPPAPGEASGIRHHARRDGTLVKVEARIVFDGGAYASSSTAVIANATCFAAGPYRVPNAKSTARRCAPTTRRAAPCAASARCRPASPTRRRWTSSPPPSASTRSSCGCSNALAHRRPAAHRSGHHRRRAGRRSASAPAGRSRCRRAAGPRRRPMALPGGAGRTATVARRPARRRLRGRVQEPRLLRGLRRLLHGPGAAGARRRRRAVATVHVATAEVGQGFVTLAQQIARAELGVSSVVLHPADTQVGSAGSTSASRQTMDQRRRGAAGLRRRPRGRPRAGGPRHCASPPADMVLDDGELTTKDGERSVSLAAALRAGPVEAYREFHHPPTDPLDENGQGNAHWSLAFAAHRAVVDVDERARAGPGGADRHRPGHRQGAEPARRSPARSRAASRRVSGSR